MQFDTSPQVESSVGFCSSANTDVQQQQQQYRRLKELVVAGFKGMGWQTGFVRIIMKRSPLLRRVHLLDGQVMDNGQELPSSGTSVSEPRLSRTSRPGFAGLQK